ncbi:hypothetical protein D3C85_1760530 [compost metagenome]
MPPAHHERCRRHRPADHAILNHLQRSLDPGTQKGFRGAANQQSFGSGCFQHLASFLSGNRQRFLNIDMFASFQCPQTNLGMRSRNG